VPSCRRICHSTSNWSPARQHRRRELLELFAVLRRTEQYRRRLADQRVRVGVAVHLGKARIARLAAPVACEHDAGAGVLEDRLVVVEQLARQLGLGLALAHVLEQPHRAVGRPRDVHRTAVQAAPEARAVVAHQQLLALVRSSAGERAVGLAADLERRVVGVEHARRLAVELVRRAAEDLLEAPVAAQDRALAQEHDAHRHRVEQQLVLEREPVQPCQRHLAPGEHGLRVDDACLLCHRSRSAARMQPASCEANLRRTDTPRLQRALPA